MWNELVEHVQDLPIEDYEVPDLEQDPDSDSASGSNEASDEDAGTGTDNDDASGTGTDTGTDGSGEGGDDDDNIDEDEELRLIKELEKDSWLEYQIKCACCRDVACTVSARVATALVGFRQCGCDARIS